MRTTHGVHAHREHYKEVSNVQMAGLNSFRDQDKGGFAAADDGSKLTMV